MPDVLLSCMIGDVPSSNHTVAHGLWMLRACDDQAMHMRRDSQRDGAVHLCTAACLSRSKCAT